MQVAVRSYLTAGVAAVGATALLITPISPPAPPEIQVPAISSAKVALAAAVDPITPWLNVFETTFANVVGIGTAVASDPAPALRQLITNQLGYAQTLAEGLTGASEAFITWATENVPTSLQAAIADLSQGNVTGAAQEINDLVLSVLLVGFSLIDVVAIPGQMADSFARVVNAVAGFDTLLPLVIGALGPVSSAIQAIGAQGQALVDAFGAGDPLGAINAIINTPAVLTGAVLNGFAGVPGLLTFDPVDPANSGLFAALFVTIPQAIAAALAPPAPVAPFTTETTETTEDPASLPDVAARTVSLEAPADTVVETPKTEVEPISTVVDEVESPVTEEVVTEAEPETAAEPEAEVVTEEPADARTDTKDGNKAVPGVVNTGATNNGTPTAPESPSTPTEVESPTTAVDPEAPAGAGETTNTTTESNTTDSGAGDE